MYSKSNGPAKEKKGGSPRQRGGAFLFLAALLSSCASMGHYQFDSIKSCSTSFTGHCGAELSYYTVHLESYRMPPAINEIISSRMPQTIYPRHIPLRISGE